MPSSRYTPQRRELVAAVLLSAHGVLGGLGERLVEAASSLSQASSAFGKLPPGGPATQRPRPGRRPRGAAGQVPGRRLRGRVSCHATIRRSVTLPVASAGPAVAAAAAGQTPKTITRLRRVSLHDKRIVLTGGAGFIGTTLTRRLIDDNEIVVLDNLHRDALAGTDVSGHPNLTFVQADVLDARRSATRSGGRHTWCTWPRSQGSTRCSRASVRTMRVNMIGTYNVLEAAQATIDTVERLVDLSTSEVFGRHAYKVEEIHETAQGSVGEAR